MSDEAAPKARAERLARALRDNLRRRKGARAAEPDPAESTADAVDTTGPDERPR